MLGLDSDEDDIMLQEPAKKEKPKPKATKEESKTGGNNQENANSNGNFMSIVGNFLGYLTGKKKQAFLGRPASS